MSYKWQCPYCGSHQVVGNDMSSYVSGTYSLGDNKHRVFGIASIAIACANAACGQVQVDVWLAPSQRTVHGYAVGQKSEAFLKTQLMPESMAKPQPPYIPPALVEDNNEACRIRDLSPKAAATLAQRCLQGVIRDFCGVNKHRLFDEIEELRRLLDQGQAPAGVSPESVDAIDDVRGIGNIGAHMERDINLIIPVDPEEAQLLVELIESLFEEWYGARENRRVRLEKIKAAAASKKQLIDAAKQLPAPKPE